MTDTESEDDISDDNISDDDISDDADHEANSMAKRDLNKVAHLLEEVKNREKYKDDGNSNQRSNAYSYNNI